MVYMRRSPGGPCSSPLWIVAMRGAEQAPGVVRLLCSNTPSVKLYRLGPASPRGAVWRHLGGEGGWLEGSRRGRGRVVLRSMQRKEKEEIVVDPLS